MTQHTRRQVDLGRVEAVRRNATTDEVGVHGRLVRDQVASHAVGNGRLNGVPRPYEGFDMAQGLQLVGSQAASVVAELRQRPREAAGCDDGAAVGCVTLTRTAK